MEPIIYRIDAQSRLTWFNQAWRSFALANAGEALADDRFLGSNLRDCIEGRSLKSLYQSLIERAREGYAVSFDFRCDAPDRRRWYTMEIRLHESGDLEFGSTLNREEAREPVDLLKADAPRNDQFVRICSWCQLMATGQNTWAPVEQGVRNLGLLEADDLPQLSHTICPTCQEKMLAELQGSKRRGD